MKTPKITISILFWLSTGVLTLHAQENSKIDSLLAVTQSMPNDTAKVGMYSQICRLYTYDLGNFELANTYLDSVKILSNRLRYENGTVHSYFLQGLINQESRNYKEALNNFEKASQFYLKNGDSLKAFNAIQGIAQIYGNQGDYEKSLDLHFIIIEFFERRNELYPVAVSFRNIANILRKIERYDDSKKYQRKSLDILNAQGHKALYAMGLQNLANVYVDTGDNDTALELYKEAIQVIRLTGNKNREAFILTNMGYLFGELNQLDKAVEYQLEAVSIWKSLSQHTNMIEALDNLGSIYFKLKKYDQAESIFKEALPLTKEAGSKTIIAELYRELSEVYVAKADYKEAYIYNNRFLLLKDSIFNIENAKQIAELQTKYETEKKDQQITLLAAEKELQEKETQRQATLKNALIGGVLLILLLASLLFYTLRQRLKNQKTLASKNEELNQSNYKRQLTELEMKALQAQINPHFIFNCMNSINDMILEGDNPNASKYLTKFSKLIRLILENAETTEVSLKNEVDLLEAYMQLEALRFKGNIDHHIKIKDNIDMENTYLPSMVLQPFVENAIWHGLLHKKETENGQITISIEQQDEQLVCTIEDNGVGRQKAFELQQKSVWKSKSLGLKITEERLRLLSKKLQQQLISIIDLKDKSGQAIGTRVIVNIPMA